MLTGVDYRLRPPVWLAWTHVAQPIVARIGDHSGYFLYLQLRPPFVLTKEFGFGQTDAVLGVSAVGGAEQHQAGRLQQQRRHEQLVGGVEQPAVPQLNWRCRRKG